MTTLLHISASPRGQRSESLALAETFVDELRAARPEVTVEHWDLWDGTLPAFGPPAAAAKRRRTPCPVRTYRRVAQSAASAARRLGCWAFSFSVRAAYVSGVQGARISPPAPPRSRTVRRPAGAAASRPLPTPSARWAAGMLPTGESSPPSPRPR